MQNWDASDDWMEWGSSLRLAPVAEESWLCRHGGSHARVGNWCQHGGVSVAGGGAIAQPARRETAGTRRSQACGRQWRHGPQSKVWRIDPAAVARNPGETTGLFCNIGLERRP